MRLKTQSKKENDSKFVQIFDPILRGDFDIVNVRIRKNVFQTYLLFFGKITLYPLKLIAICNFASKVTTSSIATHKVEKIFNLAHSVQNCHLNSQKSDYMAHAFLGQNLS